MREDDKKIIRFMFVKAAIFIGIPALAALTAVLVLL